MESLEGVNFKIPTKNEYLPQNVDIRKGEEQKYPEEIKVEHEYCRVWFKQDDMFD